MGRALAVEVPPQPRTDALANGVVVEVLAHTATLAPRDFACADFALTRTSQLRSFRGMDAFDRYIAKTTQAEVARQLGVSPVTVNQWVKRECNPSAPLMFALERISAGAVPMSVWPARRVDRRRKKPTTRRAV